MLNELCLCGSSGASSFTGQDDPLDTDSCWRYGGGGGGGAREDEDEDEERLLAGEGGGFTGGGGGAGVGGRGLSRL